MADTEKFLKDWHFANESDELMQIETAIYSNNNQVKRFTLSDGRPAVVRELLGADSIRINKVVATDTSGADKEQLMQDALFHEAVKIDGKQLPIEDYAALKYKDYSKIQLAVQSLNF